MDYTTKKHPFYKNCYVQKDKDGKPVVVYYFANGNVKVLNKITVIDEQPRFFVLPQVPVEDKECVLDADYTFDCSCLNDIPNFESEYDVDPTSSQIKLKDSKNRLTFVFTGNTIRMEQGSVPMRIVLANGQSLHAVTEKHSFNEPHSYLLVAPTQEKTSTLKVGNFVYNRKFISQRVDYAFTKPPKFTFSEPVTINRAVVFNPQTQDLEVTSTPETYNRQKFQKPGQEDGEMA